MNMASLGVVIANLLLVACRAQIQICRTHPRSNPRRRARRRRSIPSTAKPPERLNMDNRVQISHYCPLHDPRGGTERDTEIPGKWTGAQARCEQLH